MYYKIKIIKPQKNSGYIINSEHIVSNEILLDVQNNNEIEIIEKINDRDNTKTSTGKVGNSRRGKKPSKDNDNKR